MAGDPLPKEFLKEVADFTLQVCTPLYWHDRTLPFPKKVNGASCFILRFPQRLVGITAAHVVDAFNDARLRNSNLVCQIRFMPFALHEAIIDCDHDLDIATFAISEDHLKQISGIAMDCTGEWPPPPLSKFRSVSICGFPELMIVTAADKSAVFSAYGALSAIEDFSDREILLTYDPAREKPLGGPESLPPLGFNMSGCSGGPAIMHGERNGLHRWFPIGLIIGGSRRDGVADGVARGDAEAFDIIRVRRVHCVREDGSISRPDDDRDGWLPRSKAPI